MSGPEPQKNGKHLTSKLKVILILVIVIVAAVAGGYYYLIPHAPQVFSMTVNPPFFHASPGGGTQVLVEVIRLPGFNGQVNVTVTNTPSWVSVNPIIINSTSINGTLTVRLANQAQFGSYQLSVVGSAVSGLDQTVPVSMKVVSVKQVASQYGSAAVYDTTKSLNSETLATLVSSANGTLQFSKTTPQLDGLDRGDVIVAPPNATKLVPQGFLLTVLGVRKGGGAVFVDTRLAALTEVFQELHFGHTPPATTSSSGGLSTSAIGLHPEDDVTDLCASQISCVKLFDKKAQPDGLPAHLSPNGHGDVTLDAYIVAKAYAYAYGDISCCVNVDFGLLFLGHEEAYAGITGSKGSLLQWAEDNLAKISSATIVIFPGLLWIDINLNLAGQASGTLKEDVSANVDQFFNVVVGLTYSGGLPSPLQSLCNTSNSGFDFCHYHNFQPPKPTFNIGLPTDTGDGFQSQPTWPIIAIGPRLSADVDGVAGLGFEILAFVLLNTGTGMTNAQGANWPCETNYCPIWVLYFGIGASLDLWINIHVWKASYTITWPRIFQWEIAHADNLPPSTPVLGPPNAPIDLTNPSFLNPTPIDWIAVMPLYGASYSCAYQNSVVTSCTESGAGVPSYTADPEGENVTCIWMSKEVGGLGKTPAYNTHSQQYPGSQCAAPPLTSFPIDQIIANGVTQLTVTVVAEDAGGRKSSPSNAEILHIHLPLPVLQIQYPANTSPPQTITQGMPFNAIGTARLATVVSSNHPDGIIHLCLTEPQNIAWFVGGYYQADIVDVGEGGWVGAESFGAGCFPSLVATSPGQTTINMALLTTDPQTGNQYIAQDNNGNPIFVSVTVTVQAQTSQPPPGGTSLVVVIATSAGAYSSNPPITPSSPPIQLSGTVTGGTPPYTITWYAQWESNTATIVTGDSSVLNYAWNVAASCNALGSPRGTVLVFLKAMDSTGATGNSPAGPIQVNVNCQVAQSVPPSPGMGVALVSLLAVLFAVTAERTMLQGKLWHLKSWLHTCIP